MTPPLSLPALLALIEEATPGPRAVVVESSSYPAQADAAFVAAFNPSTARALIEALQEAVEALRWLVCPACGWMPGEDHNEHQGCKHCRSNADAYARFSAAITLPEQTT